jgi:hypothetical protein
MGIRYSDASAARVDLARCAARELLRYPLNIEKRRGIPVLFSAMARKTEAVLRNGKLRTIKIQIGQWMDLPATPTVTRRLKGETEG